MIMFGTLRVRGLVPDKLRVRLVLGVLFPIGNDRTKIEVSQMPPSFQHDSAIEWLAFAGHDNTIVLAPGVGIMFAPAHLKALKIQFIKSKKQVLRPLVAV